MNSKLMNLAILVLFVTCICVPEVKALRCYVCDSRINTNCFDKLSSNEVASCRDDVKSCYKVSGKLNKDPYIARSCLFIEQCVVTGINETSGHTYKVDCSRCDTELCNSADSLLVTSRQIGFVSVIFAFVIKNLLY